MTTILSFAALFASIFLVQLGSGSLGPLDVLAADVRGFSAREIGLMGSAHFAGFLLGCFLAPRLIGTVGHSRVFAAAAAIGAVGALMHPVLEGPYLWAGLRVLTGIAIAAAYTVIESWLQAKTQNHNRGRVYGVFRVVDLVGQITAQGMIAVLDPASYAAYNIVAMFCCLCLLPLALSRRAAPVTPSAPRLRPLAAWRLSPTAMLGVIVAALSASAFRMIGPVYGLEKGLDQTGIALFLSAALVGGVSAQIPIGWLADRIDRRRVLMAVSLAAVVACVVLSRAVPADAPTAIYAGAFLFGMTAFPIYSLAATYANDYAPADFVVDLNASLIFYFSVGAIAAPLLAAELIALFGPGAMFDLIALGHLSLIGFALYRATRRPGAQPAAPYAYIPRTSMVLARLFRTKGPEESGPDAGEPPDAVRQGAERPESAPPPHPGATAKTRT
ncbi:MAG: MFS transporter [Pseudomonadota bacterium]